MKMHTSKLMSTEMRDEGGNLPYHVPVLLQESVEGLNIGDGNGVWVDATFGGGGHSHEIVSRLGEQGHLYGFDQDADAYQNYMMRWQGFDAKRQNWLEKHFTFVRSNFRYLRNFLRYYGVEQVDGVLADLGVSSHHFDDAERGFSFRFNGHLDMRMNQKGGKTAADVVNRYSEEQLAGIFRLYGELRNGNRIAAAIVKARRQKPILMIDDLLEVVQPFFASDREKKDMAKVFQALRIEVNGEMDALKELLAQATEVLKPGGRLVVISYHSLEDRMVKNVMKTGNAEGLLNKDFFGKVDCPFRLVNSKVIVPDAEELARNPRSRSAKLRIAEKRVESEK